jgi:hypothetical protein
VGDSPDPGETFVPAKAGDEGLYEGLVGEYEGLVGLYEGDDGET